MIKLIGKDFNMASGQKQGGWTFLSAKREIWQDAIDQESLKEFEKKFDSIENNIKKVERYLSWPESLDQKVTVTDEFMKFFGLKK